MLWLHGIRLISGMLRNTPLRRTAMKKQQKTKRDVRRPQDEARYWEWLKNQSCAVTGSLRGYFQIDRSHISRHQYGAGMGTKSQEWFAFPLEHSLHMQLEADKAAWERRWGIQEKYLLQTWERYGLEKIPESVKKLVDSQV